VAVGGIVASGLGMIAGGLGLLLVRRRRDITDPAG
jgi:LPXTG-motif cell wall-anchored protein